MKVSHLFARLKLDQLIDPHLRPFIGANEQFSKLQLTSFSTVTDIDYRFSLRVDIVVRNLRSRGGDRTYRKHRTYFNQVILISMGIPSVLNSNNAIGTAPLDEFVLGCTPQSTFVSSAMNF